MANEENRHEPYDYDKDPTNPVKFNDEDRVNDDNVFINLARKNYNAQRNAIQAQEITKQNTGKSPVMPEDGRINSSSFGKKVKASNGKNSKAKSSYVYNGKMKKHKNGKLPKSLALLLSAGFAIGGIGAITLGVNYLQDKLRDEKLANSQQDLQNMFDRETALGEFNTYQTQNNNISILNSDLNSILERYEQDPNSVSQDEIASLLKGIYTQGKEMVSSKVANAYNDYKQETNSSLLVESEVLTYKHSPRDGNVPYTMAYVNDSHNYVYLPSNEKLSDFIGSQMDILLCYGADGSLVEDISNEKALDYAKVGTTELNEMAISDFTYEQKLGSPVLVISEHEKEISDTNNAKTNATYVNSRDNSDKGDEDR